MEADSESKEIDSLAIMLPFPPSLNHAWLVNGKRRFRTKEYLTFEKEVKKIAEGNKMRQGFYSVTICLFPDSRRRYDADNRVKTVLDAITFAGVWEDDSLVSKLLVMKGKPATEASAFVLIERLRHKFSMVNPEDFGLTKKEYK